MVEGNNMAQIPMTDQEVKIALDALSDQIDNMLSFLLRRDAQFLREVSW